ncbi:MAG: twin-arginine translocase subunit TatC [Rickettsiales bacterium]|jgi:sec-independent protein translocase protein TatC|nr:twin-arginine translocase subunit TatC [Rickettsiales bacterium]
MQKNKMTLIGHFSELRRRLVWVVLFFLGAFCAGWFIAPVLQKILSAPLNSVWSGAMLYTGVADGLMINLSLSALFAIFLTVPFFLYQAWAFVAPGLKAAERKFAAPILILSPLLFLTGAAFAYFALLPIVFGFFVTMNMSAPVATAFLPAVSNYMTFTIGMLKIFGIAFQLPIILVGLNRIGILSRAHAVSMRRYIIVAIFIVAAVLTPPDVVSQIVLALPLWALYEMSLLFMKKN